MEKIWRIIDIVRWGEEYFSRKGIESPRLTIELILCEVLKTERIYIYTNFEKPLQEDELTGIRDAVKRKLKREPLQYIFGKADFFGASLKLDTSVLIPRPETELLVIEAAKTISENNFKTVLDIGTGSGCIALSLAKKFPALNFTGIDNFDCALKTAALNAGLNKLENVVFKKMDILKDKPEKKYDLIISNPPYIPKNDYALLEPEVKYFEPRQALTDEADGLTFYRRFAGIFIDLLLPGGGFILEIGEGQSPAISGLFKKNFYITVVKDFAGTERILKGIPKIFH